MYKQTRLRLSGSYKAPLKATGCACAARPLRRLGGAGGPPGPESLGPEALALEPHVLPQLNLLSLAVFNSLASSVTTQRAGLCMKRALITANGVHLRGANVVTANTSVSPVK
ncbi:hypothetical protein EYF80_028559 [Liparis tanakae]|uniref:Uncharacterized protein n=1 Tax=Liparis tanakae TaxID=230148 RepID=A0A4Z2H8S4_9TELE|nr:hypothetical protein EYF80_028559 [Liparis tanakae]